MWICASYTHIAIRVSLKLYVLAALKDPYSVTCASCVMPFLQYTSEMFLLLVSVVAIFENISIWEYSHIFKPGTCPFS